MHKRREAGLEQSTSASAWVDVRVRYDDCDADRDDDNAFSPPSSNLHQEDEEVMRGPMVFIKGGQQREPF